MTSGLKAYSVQADECGEVVFAKNGAEARRKGAGYMDLDWEDIVSCRRAPQFDEFAPGPVPELALWKSGWNFLCTACEALICDDGRAQMINDRAYCEDHAPAVARASLKESGNG